MYVTLLIVLSIYSINFANIKFKIEIIFYNFLFTFYVLRL